MTHPTSYPQIGFPYDENSLFRGSLMQPGITAVIPTFNRAHLLGEAIESVLAQNFEPLEVIVVDDGSTDETPQLIARISQISKNRIRLISQANKGQSVARNVGVHAAAHDLIAFLDSDNLWRPGKLNDQVARLREGGYGFSFTAYTEFGPASNNPRTVRVDNWDDDAASALKRLLIGCLINTSTVVAHRDVLIDADLFDGSVQPCEDHDLWLKVALRGHRFGYVDAPLTDYRVHDGSVSGEAAAVARSTERLIERLFRDHNLPPDIQAEQSVHLARWYLNSACRYIEGGQPAEARKAIWRAVQCRPTAIRPGWIRILLDSVVMGMTGSRNLPGG